MIRVKICGITCPEDGLAAAGAGADLLGFVFCPPSPRYVEPARAAEIIAIVRHVTSTVQFVGVFVNEELATLQQTVTRYGLDYAQLHGTETPELTAALMDRGIKVIKAFRIRDRTTLAEIERYRAAAYLLDGYAPDQPGGTGKAFDWSLACEAKRFGPILLAGGLTPENVSQAVQAAHPWGVDVSTGVEASPGCKDHDKLRRFIAAVKGLSGQKPQQKPKPTKQETPRRLPDARGYFGHFGGKFVPETLMPALEELEHAYNEARSNEAFQNELEDLRRRCILPSGLLITAEAQRSTSSGRISPTPVRTRSTTLSDRPCWPVGWESIGWWQRRVPASTASPPPQSQPCSAWSASSTWARKTWPGRPPTWSACVFCVHRYAQWIAAAAPSKMRSTKRSATG